MSRHVVTILDGGIGHELKIRGVSDGTFLAGVLANESQPGIVEAVHADYCTMCDVITTNSFVAVPDRMVKEELVSTNEDEKSVGEEAKRRTAELIFAAVQRAKAASAAAPVTRVRVAGCVPPLTECYLAAKVSDDMETMMPDYELILSTLIDADVDLLLAETLSTTREGLAVVRALSNVAKRIETEHKQVVSLPLWLSFTIDDDRPSTLRSGEELSSAMNAVLGVAASSHVNLRTIGVNCASPRAISEAIPLLVSIAEGACSCGLDIRPEVMAYGNAFRTTTSDWIRSEYGGGDNDCKSASSWRLDGHDDYDDTGCMLPQVYARYAKGWVDAGVSIVGGCCGCGPLHMRAVVSELRPSRQLGPQRVHGFRQSDVLNLLRKGRLPVPPLKIVPPEAAQSRDRLRDEVSSLLQGEDNCYSSIVVSPDDPAFLSVAFDSSGTVGDGVDEHIGEQRIELSGESEDAERVAEGVMSILSSIIKGGRSDLNGSVYGGVVPSSRFETPRTMESDWIVRASSSNGRIGLLLRPLPTLLVHVGVDDDCDKATGERTNVAPSSTSIVVKGACLRGSRPFSTKPFGIDPGSPQHHWGLDLLWQLGKIYCYSRNDGANDCDLRLGGPYPSKLGEDQDGWEKVRWTPDDAKLVFGRAIDAARALLNSKDVIGPRQSEVVIEMELTFGRKVWVHSGSSVGDVPWKATFDDSRERAGGAFSDLLDVAVVGAFGAQS